MDPRKKIQEAITRAVNEAVDAVIELLKSLDLKNPKMMKAKKSEDSMRCVFRDKSGHRCKNRSRGPRFHYLCVKHEARS